MGRRNDGLPRLDLCTGGFKSRSDCEMLDRNPLDWHAIQSGMLCTRRFTSSVQSLP